ncbi:MAG: hypothetical protein K6G22_06560 [Lachnospiraceae bacterium]|nr:hypothetical protein [Lachnospiraceae bacterium]
MHNSEDYLDALLKSVMEPSPEKDADNIPADISYETDMPTGDMPVTDMPVIDIPTEDIPVADMPIMDEPIGDMPIGDMPMGDEPIPDMSAMDMPISDEIPTDIPIEDMPAMDMPIMDEPIGDMPIGDMPIGDMPIGDMPIGDIPISDEIPADIPVEDMSAMDMPIDDTPADIPIEDMPAMDMPIMDEPIGDMPISDETPADMPAEDAVQPDVPDDGAAGDMMSDSDLEALLNSIDDMGDPSMSDVAAIPASFITPDGSAPQEETDTPQTPDAAEASDVSSSDPGQDLSDIQAMSDESDIPEMPEMPDMPDMPDLSGSASPADFDQGSKVDISDDAMGQDDIERLLAEASASADDGMPDLSGSDLNDILSGIDDMDAAEIGDLLNKDDNNEAVDTSLGQEDDNYDPVAAIMGGTDEPAAPGVLYTEEELAAMDPVEKKRALKEQKKAAKAAKKEQKRLEKEAKKKKGKKEPADDLSDEEAALLAEAAGIDVADVTAEKPEKKGLFSKIISAISEGGDEDEDEKFAEESAVDIAVAGASDNEKILAELEATEGPETSGEEKKKKKKEKKPKKEKPKKEKKPPKPKKEKRESFIKSGPTIRIPKKKVLLTFFMCASLGVLVGITAYIIPFYLDMNKAEESYDRDDYENTFLSLTGHRLSSEEQELYNKNLVLYRVQRKYQSYENYMALGMKLEALNSLVQGVETIDNDYEKAESYGVREKYNALSQKIIDALDSTFGVTVDMAREWLQIKDSAEYTNALNNYVLNVSGNVTGNAGPGSAAMSSNDVIAAEEAEIINAGNVE